MNLFKAKHGAVSVFLVIILVPSLIVTSLFVDISRMYMGNSVAESASDLALNTKLSQYDKDLNDIYGLFANVKSDNANSENDVLNNLNDYLSSCMQSAGIEKTDAEKQDSNQVISDLLGIQVDKDNTTIGPVQNANLANPAELERQIVEFMKYRGPVDITKNIIKKVSDIKDNSKNVKEESELTKDMNDYLEGEGDVLKNLREAYKGGKGGMKSYMEDIKGLNINSITKYINDLKSSYEKYYEWTFKYLYETDDLKAFDKLDSGHCIKWYVNYYKNDDTHKITKENARNTLNKALGKAVFKGDTEKAIEDYNNKCKYLNKKIEEYVNNGYIKYDNSKFKYVLCNGMNSVQVYKIIYNDLGASYLADLYKSLMNSEDNFAKAYVAYDILDNEDKLTSTDKSRFKSVTEMFMTYNVNNNKYPNFDFKEFLNSDYVNGKSLVYYVSRYLKPLKGFLVSEYTNVEKTLSKKTTINNEVNDISNKLQGYKSIASSVVTKLENAKKYVDKAKDKYDKGKGLDNKYNQWGKSIEDCGDSSSLKKSSNEAYIEDSKEFRANVDSKKLSSLSVRLEKIIALWNNLIKYIDGVKFNNTKIIQIKSYKDFEKASGIKYVKKQIVPEEETLNTNYQNNVKEKFTTADVDVKTTDDNHPDLEHNDDDTKKLYKYCSKMFDNEKPEDKEKKGNYDDMDEKNDEMPDTDAADDDENDSKFVKDTLSEKEIGTSCGDDKGSGNIISRAASRISNLFSGISQYIKEPSGARDDLYVLDYIMNMFSYYTYNREGVYNIAEKKKDSGITNPVTVSSYLNKYKDDWTSDKTTFTDNKTLTNHMINLKNNYSFGNEVEYFLNGGTIKENRSKVFADIYLIRFACNLGPEFSANWSAQDNPTLDAFASAINMFCKYLPVPFIKLVVILALTATESGIDLHYLKMGMKVPIVKKKEDLIINFGNSSGSISKKGAKNKKSSSFSIQYSDYLTLFLFTELCDHNKTSDGGESSHNKILKRVSKVIGKNITIAKGGESDFDMSSAVTYYQLTTKVKVEPLLLKLPLMSDSMNKVKDIDWFSWNLNLIRGYN